MRSCACNDQSASQIVCLAVRKATHIASMALRPSTSGASASATRTGASPTAHHSLPVTSPANIRSIRLTGVRSTIACPPPLWSTNPTRETTSRRCARLVWRFSPGFYQKLGSCRARRGFIGASAFPDGKTETTSLTASEQSAVIEFTGRGTQTGPLRGPAGDIPPTGRTAEIRFIPANDFQQGKIAHSRLYFVSLGLMVHLGVIPAPARV